MSRDYNSLVTLLKQRSATKAAGAEVKEKDPQEKGTVVIPKDPNATTASMNLPGNSTNSEQTPTTSPPPVATTIKGEEKPAAAGNISKRASDVVAALRNLNKKAAGAATAEAITPTLPKTDNKNEDKNKEGLPSTGKGTAAHTPDPNVKAGGAADMPGTTDPAAKDAPKPKGDGKGEIPTDATNKDTTTKGAADGTVNLDDGRFDPVLLAKIACLVMSVEDGRAIAMREIEKANGAAAAQDIIKAASYMQDEIARLDALEDAGVLAAQELWDQATPEERTHITKIAAVHQRGREAFATELEKNAYDNGAALASQAADSGMAEAPEGQAPEEAGGVTPEDIAAELQTLVESGQITPEIAAEILQAISGEGGAGGEGGGEGAAPGGMPPGAEGGAAGGGMPPGMGGGEPDGDEAPEQKEAATILQKVASVTDALIAEMTAPPKTA